jgi:hypothetical protein
VSERLELNDELLCAYMNGELDAGMHARVEQALIDDAGARVRLERMRGKPAARSVRVPVAWAVGISALAAGISGVVLGFVLSRSQPVAETPVVASTASTSLSGAPSNTLLLATLENGESGKAATEGDRSVQIILTFESEDGRYCRAFGARDARAAAEGVACHNGAQWQVVAWDGTADPDEEFRAAGSSELLDDVMDRLGGSPALESAEERALIGRHWSSRPR